ncbi:hypothetical protein HNY73_012755 [Argiope bruennichi]|uniref:Uncharacterized protein n=1 Tax=Argiope bruennichi TaxID=94029 RepID=A0A8T0EVX4_ARGBR|nr:hypothetical protein HNY73_012755 [Argiope bruennichi]
MTSSQEDSGPVVFLLPSLTHMCLMKVATTLHSACGLGKLKSLFSETESTNSLESRLSIHIDNAVLNKRVKKHLFFIPANLRKRVWEAVKRVELQIEEWIECHENGDKYSYFRKCAFFWRSEGTIDRIKTAQEIVRSENIDIRARFQMACMYCLSESVQTLWETFESNREKLQAASLYKEDIVYSESNFWIRWLREGAQYHWTEAATKYLKYIGFRNFFQPRLNALFRELMPAERRKFFMSLVYSDMDDLRMCLYVVTKEEREEIMKLYAVDVLLAYSEWPLTGIFLDQAEKTWEFLSVSCFLDVLGHLLDLQSSADFDHGNLAGEFWERSPDHFKETAKSFFIYEKRTIEFIEKMSYKNDD